MNNRAARFVFCVIAFAASAAAQTNTFPASGSVGIGTTAPSAPLQLEAGDDPTTGSANCGAESSTCPASAASGYGFSLDSDYSTGQWRWRWEPVDRGWNISLYLQEAGGTANSYSNVVRFGSNQFDPLNSFAVFGNAYLAGNVGIGTPAPAKALDISAVGNATIGPTMRLSNPAGQAADKARIEFADGGTLRSYVEWNIIPGGTATWNFYDGFNSVSRMFIDQNGDLGIGTTTPAAKLEVSGTAQVDGSLSANGGIIFPNGGGTQTTAWTGVLCGGDYAEAVNAKGSRAAYEPGDVLVLASDTNGNVERSREPYSTMVAGIFATKPGVIGRRQSLLKDAEELPMAMVGIVPTKVTAENGPIRQGDLLVTSSTLGLAMKGTDRSRMLGAVIGKAMGSLDAGTGTIEVLVTLQ